MLREAEQYLAQAQWVVLQTPNCDPSIKSQLYRDLGLLFIAQGNASEAKKHFAEDVSAVSQTFDLLVIFCFIARFIILLLHADHTT